jgi:hypothetical protein
MKTRIVSNTKAFVSTVILLCLIVIPAHANIITVTNTNDSGPGSLRDALAIANDGDEITFAVTGSIGLTSGELVVNNSITISGPGRDNLAVNGNAKSRVFHLASSRNVTISGLTIANGNATADYGGGFYNDHSTLTLSTCTVSGNSADFGAGIYNDGSLSGGAGVTLNNSIFSSNTALEGGGIYNDGNQSPNPTTVTVNNSTFSDNSVSFPGGGIYNFGQLGNATVALNEATFIGNSAGNQGTGDGGGIYNDHAMLMVFDSTFSGNATFGGDGGGIANFLGALTINNSTFTGNSSIVVGGAIYNDGESGSAPLMLSNSTFGGNSADAAGDSIYDEGENGSAPVSFVNTIFKASAVGNFFNNGGAFISLGYNLSNDDGGGFLTGPGDQINTDPLIGPLQDNGGPTFTHALLPGSPAIDAGDPNFTPPPFYDQRGPDFFRIRNDRVDIGSFEVQTGSTPAPTPRPTPARRPRPTPAPRH